MFNALAYGGVYSNTNFMADLNQRFDRLVAPEVMPFFMNTVGTVYEAVDQSRAMQLLHAVGRKITNIFTPGSVYYLQTIGELQHASDIMQRWIMACPDVRTAYYGHRIDGYSDTYVDHEPQRLAEDHYDYRRVTNGVFMTQRDTSQYEARIYYEDVAQGDELSFREQVDIMSTWENVKGYILERGDDPTSKWNNRVQ